MPTALLSVYDKAGIVELAQQLTGWGWDLLASGGTAKVITEAGVIVKDVAELVGGGPILGHRVVTLSREIHAGLLAQRSQIDQDELQQLAIPFIDLVYVTLYPLIDTLADENATLTDVREKTDIGGPTMLCAAAKGERFVISNDESRQLVLDHLAQHNGQPIIDQTLLRTLAFQANKTVAAYLLASTAGLAPAVLKNEPARSYYQLTGQSLELKAQT